METFPLELYGFPQLQIQDTIEMPDIFMLSKAPFFINASPEDIYKYGGEVGRYMLEKAPITNKRKHVMMTSIVQFLGPSVGSIQHTDWHLDPGVLAPWENDVLFHILASGPALTGTTYFLENSITVDAPTSVCHLRPRDLNTYLNNTVGHLPHKQVESERFVTFTSRHPHIAKPAKRHELRYFCRIQETDVEEPRSWDKACQYGRAAVSDVKEEYKMFRNLEQTEDSIRIYY